MGCSAYIVEASEAQVESLFESVLPAAVEVDLDSLPWRSEKEVAGIVAISASLGKHFPEEPLSFAEWKCRKDCRIEGAIAVDMD